MKAGRAPPPYIKCANSTIPLWKFTKFLVKIREFIFVLFYDVHKENMFTINLEEEVFQI